MTNHEQAAAVFIKLARFSDEKNQQLGCDRFLSLAVRESCLAGLLSAAEKCRDLIKLNNPQHAIAKSENVVAWMRSQDNEAFFKPLDKFCSFEQAEHLLDQYGISSDSLSDVSIADDLDAIRA